MIKSVCCECIKDAHLKEHIRKIGSSHTCSVCGNATTHAISVRKLSKILEPIMCKHFRPGMIVQDIQEGRDETFQEGIPMSSIVQQVLNQFISIADDIVDSIIELESKTLNGCEPYWNKRSNYVESENGAEHYLEKWQEALDELKHSRRFFSPTAKTLFDELFYDIDNLRGWNGKVFKPVVRRFPAGTTIFRARICKSSLMLEEVANDPYRHVGPPSGEHALAGRMNPAGVSVLYSSREIETCLAEMRPAIGNDIAAIALRTTEPILCA